MNRRRHVGITRFYMEPNLLLALCTLYVSGISHTWLLTSGVYACVGLCMCMCMCVCACVCLCVCTYACACSCVCMYVCSLCVYLCM